MKSRPCPKHGEVERYTDGHCKICANARNKIKYEKKKHIYRARIAARMQDPAYREHRLATVRKASRKRKGLPTPTRAVPVICECCGKSPKVRHLALDHNHETGVFRGWLCINCNLGIGKLGDNADGLLRALAYLNRADFT